MRNTLYIIGLVFLVGIFSIGFWACGSKVNQENTEESCCSKAEKGIADDKACMDTSKETVSAKVYYFHATRRCATCEAVEKVSKEYIKDFYAGKVSFVSINREEDQNLELVEKYEIAGQTLLIIFDSEVVNLTTEAFLNARSNPEKLKELLKSTIDSRLI